MTTEVGHLKRERGRYIYIYREREREREREIKINGKSMFVHMCIHVC